MKKTLLLTLALAFTTLLGAQNAQLPENVMLRDIDGATVPSKTMLDGKGPIILSFWATWCKPCNRELDAIREVYDEWQEETGVKLVAVSIDDARSASRVRPWVNGHDWPYEVYLDQNKDLARALNVGADVPHTFILSTTGEILWQHKGYQDGGEEELIEKVRELTKQ